MPNLVIFIRKKRRRRNDKHVCEDDIDDLNHLNCTNMLAKHSLSLLNYEFQIKIIKRGKKTGTLFFKVTTFQSLGTNLQITGLLMTN